MSLDYLVQEIGGSVPPIRAIGGISGARWVCHDEREGALCPRI